MNGAEAAFAAICVVGIVLIGMALVFGLHPVQSALDALMAGYGR